MPSAAASPIRFHSGLRAVFSSFDLRRSGCTWNCSLVSPSLTHSPNGYSVHVVSNLEGKITDTKLALTKRNDKSHSTSTTCNMDWDLVQLEQLAVGSLAQELESITMEEMRELHKTFTSMVSNCRCLHTKCPLCSETIADPFLLYCNHQFCEKCIRDYPELECPVCKDHTNTWAIFNDRCQARRVHQLSALKLIKRVLEYNIQYYVTMQRHGSSTTNY